MADVPPPNQLGTPFPAPPSFYHDFTPENLAKLATIGASDQPGQTKVEVQLPVALRNLRPPTPPANRSYRSFGEERSLETPRSTLPPDTRVLPPRQAEQAESLQVTTPSPSELLTLTRSILLSYLELLHILSMNPDAKVYGEKWEDMRDLFQNVHAKINAYRAWQGRESLITLLEGEIKAGRDSVREWEEMEVKVNGVLQDIKTDEDGARSEEGPSSDLKNTTNNKHGKGVWDLVMNDVSG